MKKTVLYKIAAVLLSVITAAAMIPAAFASNESEREYDTDGATKFTFTDSGIDADDGDYDGCKINGSDLTINSAGVYILSGTSSDGSVSVKKGTTGVVLILAGLNLTSADSAPIACNKSSEVTVVAAAGSKNTLTDTEKNNGDNYPDNENAENAVIKCKDGSKVTICGTGELTVNALGKNGIKSGASTEEEGEAYLYIKELTLTIKASVNDAVNAEALLNIYSGSITIDAGDDALHCDYIMNVGEEGTAGPAIKVTSCCEGLEAAELNIYSGNITIYSEDDCLNAANSDLSDYGFSLSIYGGTLYMESSSGDGIDSNGTLTISGGSTTVWTANTADNQPLDADGTITVSGGTVFAAGGSAGMGMNIEASQPFVVFGNTGTGGMGQGAQGGTPGEPPTGGAGQGAQSGTPGEPPTGGAGQGAQSGTPGEPPTGGAGQDGQGGAPGEPPTGGAGQDGQSGTPGEPPTGGAGQGAQSGTPGEPPTGGAGQDGQGGTPGEPPTGRAGQDGQSGTPGEPPTGGMGQGSVLLSADSAFEIRDSSGSTVYSGTAPYNASTVFYSSPNLYEDSEYTLYSGGAGVAAASAGYTVTNNSGSTPAKPNDDGTDAEETNPQTGDSIYPIIFAAVFVALGGGAAAAAVIIVRKRSRRGEN